jgi:hypothetical protein
MMFIYMWHVLIPLCLFIMDPLLLKAHVVVVVAYNEFLLPIK